MIMSPGENERSELLSYQFTVLVRFDFIVRYSEISLVSRKNIVKSRYIEMLLYDYVHSSNLEADNVLEYRS